MSFKVCKQLQKSQHENNLPSSHWTAQQRTLGCTAHNDLSQNSISTRKFESRRASPQTRTTMSYSRPQPGSPMSPGGYDSDGSSSSRTSRPSRRQYAEYGAPHHRRNSSRLGMPQIPASLAEDEEEVEGRHTHGEPGLAVSPSTLLRRLSRLFKSHRRAAIILGLLLLASSTLHLLNQPYVDVQSAKNLLDDAVRWGGKKVGMPGAYQSPDCQFRSTVEGE
jgi:hypothetical protein